jgi:hypothetical protein
MQAAQTDAPHLEVIYNRVKADSQFSLDYLRAVESVVDVVVDARNNAETTGKACNLILTHLAKTGGYDKPLDPTGKLTPKSVRAEAVVKKTILAFQEINWSVLPAEHAEEMSERSEDAIVALQKLHDALVDLRWAVLEHDADLEEPEGEAIDNVDDLIADLRSG